jgi:hypothetical protein
MASKQIKQSREALYPIIHTTSFQLPRREKDKKEVRSMQKIARTADLSQYK